jgi:acyl-CoA synthetase (AMP-forming)/AMP-acid ligase II
MNVARLLRARALEAPERPAIIERAGAISFAEFDTASAAAAAMLAARGVLPGARVLLLSPMSIDLYVAIVAIFRVGATVVFVDPAAGTAHLTSCLARVRPDAFIGVGRAHLLRFMSPALRAVPLKMTLRRLVAASRNAGSRTRYQDEPLECSPVTPAIITFTSGSTGEPKAAVRTHGFLMAQHRALADTLRLSPGGVDLTTLPIVALANLASGVTTIVPDANLRAPGAIDPEPVLDQIRRLQPDSAVASPALLDRLADCAESLPHLSRIFTGGAPVFPSLLDRLARAAPAASPCSPVPVSLRASRLRRLRCAFCRTAGGIRSPSPMRQLSSAAPLRLAAPARSSSRAIMCCEAISVASETRTPRCTSPAPSGTALATPDISTPTGGCGCSDDAAPESRELAV